MAASMVVFVFAYVLVMKILYKLSRLVADWLAAISTGVAKRENELKETIIQLKSDQLKISVQDEFAKYMRIDRKVNQLNREHSQLAKERTVKLSWRQRILKAICIGLLGMCHLAFLFMYRKDPVTVLPVEWFYPLNSILAFPTGVSGAIGLPCWIITSNTIISMTLF
ncbi:unnamed protein product [Porites evermanni]|uniref:Guided entry of tail-anchored proteins factor 1 n=1 Tax=Porites evermanni TaxID=104178 RepID=A0ABN8SJ18_9CNID|nr:unnamed protein product [Porites evermanni]